MGIHLVTRGPTIGIWQAVLQVLGWTPYQFLVGVKLFLDIRKVLFRFFDKDIKERNS